MNRKIVLVLFTTLVFFSCERPGAKTGKVVFSSLPEQQKRLPENALSAMTVAEGLQVNLFAAEPMVTNPTNISVDEKGRVWICEAYNYDVSPEQGDREGDRIIVLEDSDHDGKADKRTVFFQSKDVITPLGIMASGNEVYVTNPPYVLVFRDVNQDLVADKIDTLFSNMKKGEHSAHALLTGPDGKFYFSMGNYMGDLHDGDGNPVVDKAGFEVSQKGKPYLGGMVVRFTSDLKNFEVLGHNFRNNFEPCIDSYGNIWQSDNDDDGNESCRINFILPYGNYGFLDEFTRASWKTNRMGLEEKIPDRHWHQNDPGVIPNVAITGAGSPAGMAMYEGEALPEIFRGKPIHAEPYYNVLRAYVTKKDGAGYSLTTRDILKSEDAWFRPVDVATAPDGSLIVADWYDPILGGGAAGDAGKGRIYRVAADAQHYTVVPADLSSVKGAAEALKNPNPETRYAGYRYLEQEKENALSALEELWKCENPVFRARALWLLSKLKDGDVYSRQGLTDADPDIRITAVRAVFQNKTNVVPLLQDLVNDPEAQVRREIATSLRFSHTRDGAGLWVALAKQYDGKDRWYLEALGVGADLHADLYFNAWLKNVKPDLENRSHQDIIWRSRSSGALPLLAQLIKSASKQNEIQRYFRAFDFHANDSRKAAVLLSLTNLETEHGREVASFALQQMDAKAAKMTPSLTKAIAKALHDGKGTVAFVNLVDKFSLKDKGRDLLAICIDQGGNETASAAFDLLERFGDLPLVEKRLHGIDSVALPLLQSMKGKSGDNVFSMLTGLIRSSGVSLRVRKAAVQTLGTSWAGEEKLLSIVKARGFPPDLKAVAASILFNVYRSDIQRDAAHYLPAPAVKDSHLPPIKQLLASGGNINSGEMIFRKYCTSCHRIRDEGANFGPQLNLIGQKLSREGLYRAILYPDEAISNGYESYLFTLQDGNRSLGIVTSETDNFLQLLQPGGIRKKLSKAQIKTRLKNERSLMPDLTSGLTQPELVDLVTFLETLK